MGSERAESWERGHLSKLTTTEFQQNHSISQTDNILTMRRGRGAFRHYCRLTKLTLQYKYCIQAVRLRMLSERGRGRKLTRTCNVT